MENQWRRMENIYEAGAFEIAPRYLKKMFQEPVDYEREGESEVDEN